MEDIKVIFDIEVVPNLPRNELVEKLAEIGNDEEKLEEFNKHYIFSPIRNKIVSISAFVLIPEEAPSVELFFSVDNESDVVNGFYNMLKEIKESGYTFTLVGYNINTFDIPLFRAKSAKYIPTQNRCDLLDRKPWETFDIFEKLGKKGKLHEWLEFYGLPKKYNDLTGADFLNLYLNNDEDSMKNYSQQDAYSEAKLYKQVENL